MCPDSKLYTAEVIVFAPFQQTFSYLYPKKIEDRALVIVPFGHRRIFGIVDSCSEGVEEHDYELKFIFRVIDGEAMMSMTMLKIAKWLSSYYLYPLGDVVKTMLPLTPYLINYRKYRLTAHQGEVQACQHIQDLAAALRDIFRTRKTLQTKTIESKWQAIDPEYHPGKLQEAVDRGLLKEVRENEPGRSLSIKESTASKKLTGCQERAFRELVGKTVAQKEKKPCLFWGITGSGKTEIYLHLIQRLIDQKVDPIQVLILVPEISLTSQMTGYFESRFPGKVAVVHSGQSQSVRLKHLKSIETMEKSILIGPRSAVFASFRHLALIIVDEEHDTSYKQSTGLTYSARDVAVLRGRYENCDVILGSATPSLESYYNCQQDKYSLVSLSERVNQGPLPKVIFHRGSKSKNIRELRSKAHDHDTPHLAINPDILREITENHRNGAQTMVIVNRRGFAYYLYDVSKQEPVKCRHCSVSMTVHREKTRLQCHYCDFQVDVSSVCGDKQENYLLVGYGSQQLEEFLIDRVKDARVKRLDSDNAGEKDHLNEVLAAFRGGKIDILVGTQMLAKGHDFPNVTLVVLLDVDHLLSLPDFRAGEKVFQLMVQASGRAGRAHKEGKVLVQASRADHPVIQYGLNQDFIGFAQFELTFRQHMSFPPFTRMIIAEWRSSSLKKLNDYTKTVEAWLADTKQYHSHLLRKGTLRLLGPSTPPISQIRDNHRCSLIFSGISWKEVKAVASIFQTRFRGNSRGVKLLIEVDPLNLI